VPRGRPKGALNKSTKDIKALAQKHTPAALNTLVSIMGVSDSDAARVAAAKELLDRAHGKAAQSMSVEIGANDRLLQLIEGRIARAAQR
jgi:hypothetical protein